MPMKCATATALGAQRRRYCAAESGRIASGSGQKEAAQEEQEEQEEEEEEEGCYHFHFVEKGKNFKKLEQAS